MLKILVCALLSLILLATRVRWAPLVSTLLSLFFLYTMLTQPFVVASLTDPHGPNGGVGKFIGLVFNIAVGLVLFGASLGATISALPPRQSSGSPLAVIRLVFACGYGSWRNFYRCHLTTRHPGDRTQLYQWRTHCTSYRWRLCPDLG